MKNIFKTIILLLPACLTFGQQQMVLENGAAIVLSNGTSTKPTYLVIADSNANAIARDSGYIYSESEYNMVQWNIGGNTGNYVVPFGDSNSLYLPLTINISSTPGSSGGAMKFSTFHTAALNSGSEPTDVNNMTPFILPGSPSNSDNSYNVADRFYIIDANTGYTTKPAPDNITFSYISGTSNSEVASPNTLTQSRMMAQRFNSSTDTWNDWFGYGCTDATTGNIGTVQTGPVPSIDMYRSWSLWDNTMSLPMTVAGANATGCANNGTATATVYGGKLPYTYSWSNGNTSSSISSLSGGTYTLTATDAGGCSSTGTVTITQPASALSVAITSVTNISCFGGDGSATANGSGGISPYTYSWNDANTTSGPTLTAPAGTYTVTAMDANGCTATTSVTISQPSAFIYVATGTINNVSCNGGSNGVITSTPVGGNSPFTYSWSNGSTTVSTLQTATGLSAGSYTVSVTDNCNVTKTASAIVTQPNDMRDSVRAALTVNIGCNGGNGGSATLGCKGGSYPYSYLWSNGSTLITATGLSAGTYSVVVTDQNGCTNTVGGITITQPNAIVETLASITYPLCNGEKGSASISVSGGTSPYSYTWTGGYSTTATATAIPAGNYTVTVKDAHNCSSSYTFTMTQPGAIRDSNVAAAKVNITCGGNNNGSISIGVKYGTSPYTYTWTPNVSSTNTASGLSAGTYSVSVMDSHGCSGSTAVISITQPNILRDSVAFTDNVGCYGGNGGEISIGVRGGSTPYTYSWSNGKTSYLITGLTAGTYSVTITDHNNCSNQLTGIVISQPAAPISSTFSTTCVGNSEGTVTVMASGGTSPYSYTWSNGSTKTSFTFSNGTYTVTVKDAHGCSATNSVTVSCPAAPEAPPQERKGDEPPPPPGCCPSLIDVNLYPNPNTGQFTLSGLTQGMVIDIFDYTGRRISTIIASDVTMQLNIADQPNGIYLIRISGKDGTFLAQKKVVKTQ